MRSLPRQTRCPRAKAMTMAEVLVAMTLFSVVSALLLGLGISTAKIADRTQSDAGTIEEARWAIQRIGRELRQAASVDTVSLIATGSSTNALTISVDFNGNGVIDEAAYDPEVLTYRWDPTSGKLTLTANDAAGETVTRPVLAEGVTAFDVRLRSSRWVHDRNGDGTTTWEELDESGVGNRNGVPDAAELDQIDIVSVHLTVSDDNGSKSFTVQSDLRNQRHH